MNESASEWNWPHPTKSGKLRDVTFPWWLSPSKKSKILLIPFWDINNQRILQCLADSILSYNKRTRLFPDMQLLQNHEELRTIFWGKKDTNGLKFS